MPVNDQTYIGLISLRDKLDAKHAELRRELDLVAKQLESVSTTLELLDESAVSTTVLTQPVLLDASVLPSPTPGGIDIASLRGMKQLPALKKIAEHGGGSLYTTAAKQILLQAGLIKNPKNATNIIFSVIKNSGAFERIAPGHYRLINKPIKPSRAAKEFDF
jgi:hypothetical protein